jgi:hypothetical protein
MADQNLPLHSRHSWQVWAGIGIRHEGRMPMLLKLYVLDAIGRSLFGIVRILMKIVGVARGGVFRRFFALFGVVQRHNQNVKSLMLSIPDKKILPSYIHQRANRVAFS